VSDDPYPAGGGGGAGGYITATGLAVSNHLDIVVGNGGSTTIYNLGVNGGNSSLTVNDGTPILMLGGGGGGSRQSNGGAVIQNGFNGGSGGGAGLNYAASASGTAGTADGTYGKSGGASFPGAPWGIPCGGGGGAGGVGITPASSQGAGGNGGLGILNTITGSNSYYAAGGGGSADNLYSGVYGTGGSSIGGNGGNRTVSPTSGIGGTGSGGGGLYWSIRGNPGSGGSGIVIIKYLIAPPDSTFTSKNVSSSINVTAGWVGVEPFTMQFNDTSTNTPTNWSWGAKNIARNNTWVPFATTNNTQIVLNNGYWAINLTATNSFGSGISTDTIISVIGNGTPTPSVVTPVASFYGSPTLGAPPLLVYLTDASSNTPTSWNWSYGNGLYSETQNPSYTYTKSGFYTVGLTATNSAGSNTTSKVRYITAY